MSRTKVITAWGQGLIRATGAFLCQCADADPTMWRGGRYGAKLGEELRDFDVHKLGETHGITNGMGLWYGVHQWSGEKTIKKPYHGGDLDWNRPKNPQL